MSYNITSYHTRISIAPWAELRTQFRLHHNVSAGVLSMSMQLSIHITRLRRSYKKETFNNSVLFRMRNRETPDNRIICNIFGYSMVSDAYTITLAEYAFDIVLGVKCWEDRNFYRPVQLCNGVGARKCCLSFSPDDRRVHQSVRYKYKGLP